MIELHACVYTSYNYFLIIIIFIIALHMQSTYVRLYTIIIIYNASLILIIMKDIIIDAHNYMQ